MNMRGVVSIKIVGIHWLQRSFQKLVLCNHIFVANLVQSVILPCGSENLLALLAMIILLNPHRTTQEPQRGTIYITKNVK